MPAVCSPIYEVAEELGIEDEEEIEKVCEFLSRSNFDIDNVVEEFCKKYNV